MDKKDALYLVLNLSEGQMRIALVEMVYTFNEDGGFNKYEFEAILNIAKEHGQKN